MSDRQYRKTRQAKFGAALAEALRVRSWNQATLAERMGTTQSAVSAWITGKSAPVADDVFDIEEAMEMTPGVLSRHLGYQPVDADKAPPDMEVAIAGNPILDAEAKQMMLDFYRTLSKMCKKSTSLTTAASIQAKAKRAAANGAGATKASPAPR